MRIKIILFSILISSSLFSCRFINDDNSGSVQNMSDTVNWDNVTVNSPKLNEETRQFYLNRDFRLAWFCNGRLSDNAYHFLD